MNDVTVSPSFLCSLQESTCGTGILCRTHLHYPCSPHDVLAVPGSLQDVLAISLFSTGCVCSTHVLYMRYLQYPCSLHDVLAVSMFSTGCTCCTRVLYRTYFQYLCSRQDVLAVPMFSTGCTCGTCFL